MLLEVIDRWEKKTATPKTKRKEGKTPQHKPVFFIIEEFDLLGKDKILYSILNLIQTNVVFACVGITSCLVPPFPSSSFCHPHSNLFSTKRTFELMEKRVESRFADRTIPFYPIAQFTTFSQIMRDALTLSVESHPEASRWNQSIEVLNHLLSSSPPPFFSLHTTNAQSCRFYSETRNSKSSCNSGSIACRMLAPSFQYWYMHQPAVISHLLTPLVLLSHNRLWLYVT